MFKVGEMVSILNEVGTLRVVSSEEHHSLVEDENGFQRKVKNSILCLHKQYSTSTITIKDEIEQSKTSVSSKKRKFSIDLHIENLPEKKWSHNHEKLIYQLNCFKSYCNSMYRQKTKSFEVIHGHGKGILHRDLKLLVEDTRGLIMHDHQYSFGRVGSSIVEITFSKFEEFIIV